MLVVLFLDLIDRNLFDNFIVGLFFVELGDGDFDWTLVAESFLLTATSGKFKLLLERAFSS
jgi:hypothetical protein